MKKSLPGCLAVYCLLFLTISNGYAQLQPVPITVASFNQDIVAEGTGGNPQAVTSIAFDGSANNVLYTKAFQGANSLFISGGGLPNSGLITNGLDQWQLAAFTGSNVLYFAPQTTASTKSLTLSTAAKFSQLALLAACGNGSVTMSVSVHFTNSTTTSFGPFTVSDWFGGSPYVINGLGRILRNTTVGLTSSSGLPNDPRLYQVTLSLVAADQAKTVDRIDITDNSTSNAPTLGVFAVSGIASLVLPLTVGSLQGQYNTTTGSVDLQWTAYQASAEEHFEVQRAANGKDFTTLSIIPSVPATEQRFYRYSDKDPGGASWQYRVADVQGGQTVYSNVINVSAETASTGVRVWASKGRLHVTGVTGQPAYRILTATGQYIRGGTLFSSGNGELPLPGLTAGIYLLSLKMGGQVHTYRFFVD